MTTETITFDYPQEDIIWLFTEVHKNAKRNNQNYNLESSIKDYNLCYTVTYFEKTPFLGSISWARPFYNGFVRILTRYCVNPKYINNFHIGNGVDGMRIDAIKHADQQIDFCTNLGYNNFFLSREDDSPKNRNTLRILNSMNKYSKYNFKLMEDKQLVCPDPVAKSCWQYVIYSNEPFERKEI
mgnify:CR=1 FL=1